MLLVWLCVGCLLWRPVQSYSSCFGATFDTIGNGFEYRAHLNQPEECQSNATRVTRLYIAGACSIKHNNNFNGYPPACPRGDTNILDTSSETCQSVFSHANHADVIEPQGNTTFDKGSICNNGIKSVLFVETDCQQLNASSVVIDQRLLSDDLCWDGTMLSTGQLVGIVIGSIAGLCLLFGLTALGIVLYCKRRRRRALEKELAAYPHIEHGKQITLTTMTNYTGDPTDSDSEDPYNPVYDVEFQAK